MVDVGDDREVADLGELGHGQALAIASGGRSEKGVSTMLLTHPFSHQTHHHGQATGMSMQSQAAPPVLDLHRVLKPEPGG